jgi:hypothetical protein
MRALYAAAVRRSSVFQQPAREGRHDDAEADHEVALRCLYWLPTDVRPTAELLAELMYVSDGEAAQMLSELRGRRVDGGQAFHLSSDG